MVDAYDKNPQLIGKQFALAGAGETADSIARDIWDNTTISLIETYMEENDGQPPNALAMRGIYDQAEKIVQDRLALIAQINEKGTPTQVRNQVDQIVSGEETSTGQFISVKGVVSDDYVKGEVYINPTDNLPYLVVGDNPKTDRNSWQLVEVDENGDIIDSNSTNTESEEVTDLPNNPSGRNKGRTIETDEDEDEDGGALDDIMDFLGHQL